MYPRTREPIATGRAAEGRGSPLSAGCVFFAIGAVGLGLLGLGTDDFALDWQPLPLSVPFRGQLAYASGAVLLGSGVALLVRASRARAAAAFAAYALAWLLLLRVPPVIAAPRSVGAWLGWGENALLMAGAWALWASFPNAGDGLTGQLRAGSAAGVRLLYGLALPLVGLSHFVYAADTAAMVPAWLPARLGLAYFTGAGHAAAGIAVLLGIMPRLAATLEAAMITSFVALLHAPGVALEPRSRLQWTMFFVATMLAGAAWSVARSYSSLPWLAVIGRRPT